MTLSFKKGDEGIRIPKKCISLLSDADICDLRVLLFAAELERHGVRATVRRKLGGDINASCGQLRRESENIT